jgi:hypothetical protein
MKHLILNERMRLNGSPGLFFLASMVVIGLLDFENHCQRTNPWLVNR